jgi:hypothetical protein
MPDQTHSDTGSHRVLPRINHAFLLFSVTCAALLGVSSLLLLPRLSRVDVAGRMWNADEIGSERDRLTAEVLAQERERRSLLLSIRDPAYIALKEQRFTQRSVLDIKAALEEKAATLAEGKDVVTLHAIHFKPYAHAITITGDVHSVGPRSMTVLAQFVELVGRLPFVASLRQPAFTREEDPATGPHSPFTFTVDTL